MENSSMLINSDLTYLILKELYDSEKTPSEISTNIQKPLASVNNYFVKLNKANFIKKTKKEKQKQYYRINYHGIMDCLYDQDIKTTTKDEIDTAFRFINIVEAFTIEDLEKAEKKTTDIMPNDLILINKRIKDSTFAYFKFYLVDEYFQKVDKTTLKSFYDSFYLELLDLLLRIKDEKTYMDLILCNSKKYYEENKKRTELHIKSIKQDEAFSDWESNRPSLMNILKKD